MSKILIVGGGLAGQAVAAHLNASGMQATCSDSIPDLTSTECGPVSEWEPIAKFKAKMEVAAAEYAREFEPPQYRGYMGRKRRHK